MTSRIVVIGAGGSAREVLDILELLPHVFSVEGFLVDPEFAPEEKTINDHPVLGGLSWLADKADDVLAICAIGAPKDRRRMVNRARALGVRFATVIHPDVRRTRWVEIGEGCVIAAGCILTSQIKIGAHVHINVDCSVSHDSRLGDFVTLSPGVHVAGNVTIEEGAYIGVGANLIERRVVGEWSIVGAGSVIIKDILANSTAVGVPARTIKTRPEGWYL